MPWARTWLGPFSPAAAAYPWKTQALVPAIRHAHGERGEQERPRGERGAAPEAALARTGCGWQGNDVRKGLCMHLKGEQVAGSADDIVYVIYRRVAQAAQKPSLASTSLSQPQTQGIRTPQDLRRSHTLALGRTHTSAVASGRLDTTRMSTRTPQAPSREQCAAALACAYAGTVPERLVQPSPAD